MDMNEKYYFFGAGNNGYSAIDFFGIDAVIELIDNSDAKIGKKFFGKTVIGFDEFKKVYNGETVIITAYIKSEEIKYQLEINGIYNYYICPYMVNNFPNVDEITNFVKCHNSIKRIMLWGKNPITYRIQRELKKYCDIDVQMSDDSDFENKAHRQYDMVIDLFNDEKISTIYRDNYVTKNDILRKSAELMKNKLRKFKDMYNGERCFLIGNGPSLSEKDLEALYSNNEISFGCNQIFKIFNKTNWRPSFYVIADRTTFEECKNYIPNNSKAFVRNFINKDIKNKENIFWYNSCLENKENVEPKFSIDISKYVYNGLTVMYDMIQIAVYMGFREIYLIGVDFSWGEDGRNAHFCSDYMETKNFLEEMSYNKKANGMAYIAAKKYADANEIKIYNATRGGHLEVFERISFDTIFNK